MKGVSRVALVTSATHGTARALAVLLGRSGKSVVVHYGTDMTAAHDVVLQIQKDGGEALAVPAVLDNRASITELFKTAISRFGRVDEVFGVVPTERDCSRAFSPESECRHDVSTNALHVLSVAGQWVTDGGDVVVAYLESAAAQSSNAQRTYTSALESCERMVSHLAAELERRRVAVNLVTTSAMAGDTSELATRHVDGAQVSFAEVCAYLTAGQMPRVTGYRIVVD